MLFSSICYRILLTPLFCLIKIRLASVIIIKLTDSQFIYLIFKGSVRMSFSQGIRKHFRYSFISNLICKMFQNIFRKVTDILLQLLQMDEPYNLSQYVTLEFLRIVFLQVNVPSHTIALHDLFL